MMNRSVSIKSNLSNQQNNTKHSLSLNKGKTSLIRKQTSAVALKKVPVPSIKEVAEPVMKTRDSTIISEHNSSHEFSTYRNMDDSPKKSARKQPQKPALGVSKSQTKS